jgi:hypothetical protein
MWMPEQPLNRHSGGAQRDGRLHQHARAAHQQCAAHQFDPCLGMHEVGNRGRGEAVAAVVEVARVGRRRTSLHGGDAHLRERLNQHGRKALVDLAGVGATLRKTCPPP